MLASTAYGIIVAHAQGFQFADEPFRQGIGGGGLCWRIDGEEVVIIVVCVVVIGGIHIGGKIRY